MASASPGSPPSRGSTPRRCPASPGWPPATTPPRPRPPAAARPAGGGGGALDLVRAPRAGQGGGQVGLLRQHVRRPVPQPPRLDQDDLGGVRQAVGEQPVAVDQPRQPALHAVEREAARQPLPLLPAPRLVPDQPLGPPADVVRDPQLPRREDDRPPRRVGRALVVHRELGEPVDLVAPQVDADRPVGGGREDVDDRPAARHLAPVLDQLLAPVAGRHEPGQQLLGVEDVARADDDGIDVVVARAEALEERPDAADDDAGRPAARRPASRHSTRSRRPIVSTLGLTRSKGRVSQAGNSSTSSGGRYRWRSSTSRWAAVPVGTATSSGERPGQPGQPGQRQRAGGFGHGQDRGRDARARPPGRARRAGVGGATGDSSDGPSTVPSPARPSSRVG